MFLKTFKAFWQKLLSHFFKGFFVVVFSWYLKKKAWSREVWLQLFPPFTQRIQSSRSNACAQPQNRSCIFIFVSLLSTVTILRTCPHPCFCAQQTLVQGTPPSFSDRSLFFVTVSDCWAVGVSVWWGGGDVNAFFVIFLTLSKFALFVFFFVFISVLFPPAIFEFLLENVFEIFLGLAPIFP